MSAGATVRQMMASLEPLLWFTSESTYAKKGMTAGANAGACDFAFGNPHEMPIPAIHQALQKWAAPQSKDWFAYKFSVPRAVDVVVGSLRERTGIQFDRADVAMTNGAFAALAAALRAVVDPGDEVVYLSPPWFCYVAMILSLGATPVRVDFAAPKFELPVDAIERAIGPRTKAIIVNSPHNPSGRIFSPSELERMSAVLKQAPHPVYLVSDEAYSRILFDGTEFDSPVRHYDRSFLLYTYGKTLLAPGERIGYIAMPPTMPGRSELRRALFAAQLATGYAFPNAVLQYALADLEPASIDVAALQRRRDRICGALTEMGYEVVRPQGTFYVLVRSPIADDVEFTERLAAENVFVMPGKLFELPGWFRISLTANDQMVDRALPGFERLLTESTVGDDRLPGKV